MFSICFPYLFIYLRAYFDSYAALKIIEKHPGNKQCSQNIILFLTYNLLLNLKLLYCFILMHRAEKPHVLVRTVQFFCLSQCLFITQFRQIYNLLPVI